MAASVWANSLLALPFLLAWSGIPLWMAIKHKENAPDHSEGHAYLAAKAAMAARVAVMEPEPEPEPALAAA